MNKSDLPFIFGVVVLMGCVLSFTALMITSGVLININYPADCVYYFWESCYWSKYADSNYWKDSSYGIVGACCCCCLFLCLKLYSGSK
jgi:uncharacterized membrane protein HdeD (DUF308 family)